MRMCLSPDLEVFLVGGGSWSEVAEVVKNEVEAKAFEGQGIVELADELLADLGPIFASWGVRAVSTRTSRWEGKFDLVLHGGAPERPW